MTSSNARLSHMLCAASPYRFLVIRNILVLTEAYAPSPKQAVNHIEAAICRHSHRGFRHPRLQSQ